MTRRNILHPDAREHLHAIDYDLVALHAAQGLADGFWQGIRAALDHANTQPGETARAEAIACVDDMLTILNANILQPAIDRLEGMKEDLAKGHEPQ